MRTPPPSFSSRRSAASARHTRFSRAGIAGQLGIAHDTQFDPRLPRARQAKRVVQRQRLKDRAQFVIAVGAPPQHVQAQIDLGECWNADEMHGGGVSATLSSARFLLRDAVLHVGDFLFDFG